MTESHPEAAAAKPDIDLNPVSVRLVPLLHRVKEERSRRPCPPPAPRQVEGWVVEDVSNGDLVDDDDEVEVDSASLLIPGTLVWAKMAGYPSWPGLVMPAPNSSL